MYMHMHMSCTCHACRRCCEPSPTLSCSMEGHAALWRGEQKGHTATAAHIQQHVACLLLVAWLWVVLWVMLGAVATVAFSRTLMTRGQHRATRQRRPHRPARYAKAHGRTNTSEPIWQHAAPPQPAVAVSPHAMQATHAMQAAQAARAAQADAAMLMEGLLTEEEAEQAKAQAPSKKSKKKKKASRATAAGDEPSEAPLAAAPAPPPALAPKPAASAAERAEAALRGGIAGCGLSALEAALAAAPREVRKSSEGV